MEALLFIPVLVGFGAWFTAVSSAALVVRLMPKGQRLTGLMNLGFWRFDRLRAAAGTGVDPLLRRYVWSFAAFFGAIVLMMVSTFIVNVTNSRAQTASLDLSSFPAMLRQET